MESSTTNDVTAGDPTPAEVIEVSPQTKPLAQSYEARGASQLQNESSEDKGGNSNEIGNSDIRDNRDQPSIQSEGTSRPDRVATAIGQDQSAIGVGLAKALAMGERGQAYVTQFKQFGHPEDITTAINYFEQAVSLMPGGHSHQHTWLNSLGHSYQSRFERLQNSTDLEMAIKYKIQSMQLISDEHPDRPSLLNSLSVSYQSRFQQLGDLTDLNLAIDYAIQAESSTSQEHPYKPAYLNNLGVSYQTRFERLRELPDLDKAISCKSQAVSLTQDKDPSKPSWLINLGFSYHSRFKQADHLPDLNMAIESAKKAILLTPHGNLNKPAWLNNLGVLYQNLFERLGDREDLDKSVDCLGHVVSLTPDDHPDKLSRINNLGVSHQTRFDQFGDLQDLDRAIGYLSQVESLTPKEHPGRPSRLSNLGYAYQSRFQRAGDLEDLNLAIGLSSEAVSLTRENHPDKPIWLNGLGSSFQMRFKRTGQSPDLDEAIKYLTQAVLLTPGGHPSKPIRLNSLGIAHRSRFKRLGHMVDIDQAIDYLIEASSLTPDGHPRKPYRLNSLGISYHSRFERMGRLADLDLAVDRLSQAVLLAPKRSPVWLNNLAVAYQSRFRRLEHLVDLNLAIDHLKEAISLTPQGHPDKSTWLNSLGVSYQSRFKYSEHPEDIDKAIDNLKQALSLTPDGHASKPTWHNSLGVAYESRFKCQGQMSDLDLSIDCKSQGVSQLPEGHPDIIIQLKNLSYAYRNRFKYSDNPEDIRTSITCVKNAAQSASGRPLAKLNAARTWASLSVRHQMFSPLEAYQRAMELIPQVVWLGNPADQRYEDVVSIGDTTVDAAAVAIDFKQYDVALEWVEEGHSIIWNQLLQLRTPLDQLAIVDPSLAKRLSEVAQDLEDASSASPQSGRMAMTLSETESISQRHRRRAEERGELLKQVRSLPGMKDFLQAKKASSLVAAAQATAIVTVIIHRSHCHALIIRPQATDVDCLALADLSHEKVATAQAQLASSLPDEGRTDRQVVYMPEVEHTIEETLRMLWTDIAKPVMDFLGYMHIGTTNELPHITWRTTGPLAFLPLHAAGDYSQPNCSLFNYAISSFTPTLSALIEAPRSSAEFSSILAVGQAHTPGLSQLPGTTAELDQIGRQIGEVHITRLEGDEATTSAVLASLESNNWVHFACHASQNITRPTESAFHLRDGPLDLGAITRKQLKHADLAFLSACQTATGDEQLSEEAVHLAAGMIMAGYRRVIATMWSISDEDAPLVAEKFYAYMLDDKAPSEKKAARALHYAVQCLQAKVGIKKFRLWAPYIHIGL